MARKKAIEVEVYDCPGCGQELLLSRMEREGQLCPVCEDIQERKETKEEYEWMIGAAVTNVEVRYGDPRALGIIDFSAKDGKAYRLWVGWSPHWSFLHDETESVE